MILSICIPTYNPDENFYEKIKSSKGNKILSKQLQGFVKNNDFQKIIRENGYGNLNIEDIQNPTWLVHLILIYYKRLYCNKHNPENCPLNKQEMVKRECEKEDDLERW